MTHSRNPSHSMERAIRRSYFAASVIPIVLLIVLIAVGAIITRNYLTNLITQSNYELTHDAEQHLRELGEEIILSKARDVARQLEMYFRMHPDKTFEEMREDSLFMELALQPVGETGYTAVTEAHTWLFRVHPNPDLNETDVRDLAYRMPDWWNIVKVAGEGVEASGYYNWHEPDGSIREKYMAVTPVGVQQNDVTVMVTATTYIDEFSSPVVTLQMHADAVVKEYRHFLSRQLALFSLLGGGIILLALLGTYAWGRKTALHYINPLTQLTETAGRLGGGSWDARIDQEILDRPDEVGVMAQSMDHMSTRLGDAFATLEQRLAELNQAREALAEGERHYRELYEESRRAREVYQSLIDSSADAIVLLDLKGRPVYASPAFADMFGWSGDELAEDATVLVPESERLDPQSPINLVMAKGIPCRGFETERIARDGRVLNISLSASRYADHEGKPAGILMILRDISEAKKLEEHFQQVQRLEAIATLAGGVAHDFNNLMMVIQGIVSLLIQNSSPDDPNRAYYQKIEGQVRRGSRLTAQLLGYARRGKYDIRPVNINEVIQESAETIRRTRKDIPVHYQLDPHIPAVETDVAQLDQVLVNLFVNAADAMPGGGELTLTTQVVSSGDVPGETPDTLDKPHVLLMVTDTGTGMDRATQDRIFEPFFTTKSAGKGSGMGLASVYGIVKSHGGHITVSSEPARGTTFRIYLPASSKEMTDHSPQKKRVLHGKGTILIVDDEEPVLEVASEVLETIGYRTIMARTGREGLDQYRERKGEIDLVILDMIMPDLGGGEVFDHLKEIDPNVSVLLASGYSINGRAMEIINRGCVGFIQKPFTMEELSEKISGFLEPSSQEPRKEQQR